MKKQILSLSILTVISSSGLADPYLNLKCVSADKNTQADISVSPACVNHFRISGKGSSSLEQTCDKDDVQFIYAEGAKENTVIISGISGSETLHLVSTGKITSKTRADQDYLLSFAAKLVHTNWINSKKSVETTEVNCTGESFENP